MRQHFVARKANKMRISHLVSYFEQMQKIMKFIFFLFLFFFSRERAKNCSRSPKLFQLFSMLQHISDQRCVSFCFEMKKEKSKNYHCYLKNYIKEFQSHSNDQTLYVIREHEIIVQKKTVQIFFAKRDNIFAFANPFKYKI